MLTFVPLLKHSDKIISKHQIWELSNTWHWKQFPVGSAMQSWADNTCVQQQAVQSCTLQPGRTACIAKKQAKKHRSFNLKQIVSPVVLISLHWRWQLEVSVIRGWRSTAIAKGCERGGAVTAQGERLPRKVGCWGGNLWHFWLPDSFPPKQPQKLGQPETPSSLLQATLSASQCLSSCEEEEFPLLLDGSQSLQ